MPQLVPKGIRPFSSKVNLSEIKPIIIYSNCDLEKDRIFKENKNKTVVYR